MRTSNNTVLITGGSFGTGLEIAKLLSIMGNKVIITGNNKVQLSRITSENKNIAAFLCDTASENEIEKLINSIRRKFPNLNVFINNSGQSYSESEEYLSNPSADKLLIDHFSGIRITEELLPILEQQERATVIDVSLLTLRLYKNNELLKSIRNTVNSYYRLLRYKLKNSIVEVPDLQSVQVDEYSSSSMIAFRIIEMLYNKRPKNAGFHVAKLVFPINPLLTININ